MPDALPTALLDLTTYVLSLTGKASRSASTEALAAVGLRMGDMAVLAVVDHEGPVVQRTIAERLRLHPSDVVRLLDALQADALIERSPDPADRRRHMVSLTALGRDRLGVARAACERAADELLAPLAASQRVALHDLLTTVLAGVDDRVPQV